MIVGDDTRTRVRPDRSEPRHPHAATTLAPTPGRPGHTHGKTAHREGNGAGSSPARHDPINAGSDPNAPPTPYGRVPAMIIRMRLRAGAAIPGRLSTHPLCPPIAGHGGTARSPQPGRRGARDFHPRSDARMPCSGQNPGRESPTIIHGAPYFGQLAELAYDPDEDRVQCHLCGEWFRLLGGSHLRRTHGWTLAEYREAFHLPVKVATCSHDLSMQHSAYATSQIERSSGFGKSAGVPVALRPPVRVPMALPGGVPRPRQ